ncbi:MAG: BON domain-containing protein [Acidobacteriaceae bacterium]
MNSFSRRHLLPVSALALVVALGVGCKSKTPDTVSDTELTTALQSKLASDIGLANEPIQVTVANGTAILNGSVDSEAAKSLASNDAMQVPGIRGVMNNLAVQPTAVGSVQAVQPSARTYETRDRAARDTAQREKDARAAAPETGVDSGGPAGPGASGGSGTGQNQQQHQQQQSQQQPAPLPQQPPAPVSRNVTIPAGTILPVRLTDALDSATTQPGTAFHGSLASDLVVNGMVAIPQGASIVGKVDDVKDATHFKGSASITAEVNYIRTNGQSIAVSTDPYVQEGKGRGKNTLEKTGAGAAIGAILGGIFGGGKGAAVGAAAGGGVGAGSNAITKGEQVVIPSETILHFRLTSPVLVTITPGAPVTNYNSGDATLQHRSNP